MNKIKFTYIFALFFFYFIDLHANFYGFCFEKKFSLDSAKEHLQVILSSKDRIFKRESLHCIEVETSPNKESLYRNWLKKRFTIIKDYRLNREGAVTSIETSPHSNKNCRLEIVKFSSENSKTRSINLGNDNNLNQVTTEGSGQQKTQLLLQHGRKGKIKINEKEIELVCFYKTNGQLEIDITAQLGESSLSTNLMVRKGQRVNLGQIVDDLTRKKVHKNYAGVQYQHEKTEGKINHNYFLIVK